MKRSVHKKLFNLELVRNVLTLEKDFDDLKETKILKLA